MTEEPVPLQNSLNLAIQGDDQARERLFAACCSYLQLTPRVQLTPAMQAKVDASDLVRQTLLATEFATAYQINRVRFLNQFCSRNRIAG